LPGKLILYPRNVIKKTDTKGCIRGLFNVYYPCCMNVMNGLS
jgi:hypothetical protein